MKVIEAGSMGHHRTRDRLTPYRVGSFFIMASPLGSHRSEPTQVHGQYCAATIEMRPGDFCVVNDDSIFKFRCPCGCGDLYRLSITRQPYSSERPRVWHWNGDRIAPTLSPSVNMLQGCRYHGT